MGGLGFCILQLTGFRLNIISKFHYVLYSDLLINLAMKAGYLFKTRMFVDLQFYFLKDNFLERFLQICDSLKEVQIVFCWLCSRGAILSSSFALKFYQKKNQSQNTKSCLRVRLAQRLVDFLYREETGELNSWKNQFYQNIFFP